MQEMQPYIKYLCLKLDCRLNCTAQLQHSAQKASHTASLSKLMANIGGPTQSKIRLLMSTTQAVLLYAAEIWADSLDKEYMKKTIWKIQRTAALRISSAYRTVSEAVLVTSGTISIDRLAKERKKLLIMKNNGEDINYQTIWDWTLQHWHIRWTSTARGLWTLKVTPDVVAWIQK